MLFGFQEFNLIRAGESRPKAMQNTVQFECDQRILRALYEQTRFPKYELHPGDRVAFWHRRAVEGSSVREVIEGWASGNLLM